MSGSIKGEDMRQDDAAYDATEVENKVAEKLAEMRGESAKDEPEEDEPEAEDTSTPDPTDEPDEASGETEEEEEGSADEDPPKPDKKPAIPDNVCRAAVHSGWTPEEISEFYEADPKRALKTFGKMHESMSNLSKQFAQVGRARINMARKQDTDGQPQPKVEEPKPVIDVEALRRRDPDNELLPIVEGLNKVLTDLTVKRTVEQPRQEPSKGREEDVALAQQVTLFISSDGMKSYDDFYGPAFDDNRMPTWDGHGLTPGQLANRDALVARADEIWIGAKMSGRELTVPEALEMAHTLLTEPMREQQVRKELVSKVKTRAKGMTLRPNKSKGLDNAGEKPKTEAQLLQRTEARLAKLRNRK